MNQLIEVLTLIQRTEGVNNWDICDEIRSSLANMRVCPLGAGAIGDPQCKGCALNQHADWLEDLLVETH